MRKAKEYKSIRFHSRVYRRAIEACRAHAKKPAERLSECSTQLDNEKWSFDNLEEFFTSLSALNIKSTNLTLYWDITDLSLSVASYDGISTQVSVSSVHRHIIEAIFSVFEEASPEEKVLAAKDEQDLDADDDDDQTVQVFVGHGRNPQWQKLKAHLQDKHNLDVICYETGARAGHAIRDILDSMADASSMALLVLTGEDKTDEGLRARQNVIHECGLFQGRLGFDRAILVVEDGVQLASNFDGIQQLRFKRGHISEVFGDVLATIRREFGPI